MRLLNVLSFLCFCAVCVHCSNNKDPYKILGVSPSATNDQIKRAYKQLAKEWHPDKNPTPEAEKRFVEINQAYEVLSDPEKRSKYDRFGSYEATEMPEGGGHNPFANFHFGNFGGFQFNMHSEQTYFTKHRVSFRMYDSLIQQSHEKPFLIFVYADWCMSCMRAEPIWERVVSDLEPIGYGIGTVNNMLDSNIVDKLRIRRLPAIVALIEGRVIHYDEQHIDVKTVVQFARTVIPPHHVSTVNDYGYANFFDSAFRRNKAAVLMFGHQDKPRIRYMLVALKFHAYCSFGYVQVSSVADRLKEMYDVKISQETLLVFHENSRTPVASLQMKEIPSDSMFSTVETFKFLSLPRISSQRHFDELCPPSGARANRKLCAILVARADDLVHIAAFREYAETRGKSLHSTYGRGGTLRFLYIYEDKQSPFIETLAGSARRDGPAGAGSSSSSAVSSDNARNVIIVWRPASDRAQFDWLTSVWDGRPEYLNRSIDLMERRLERILKNNDVDLVNSANLKGILDENGPSLYKKLASKLMRSVETISHQLSKEEILPIVSVFGTLFAIMFVGWCLNLAVESEKKAEKEMTARKNRGKTFEETEEYKSLIHELRAETYFGMVRLLKPGCRTLVVLTDKETKAVLVPQFARAIWPWRKNRTLMFGYVMVEKNLEWFRCLLEHTLPDARDLNINPKNVVGTVLSLNGFRQHFSIYHPKHAPSLVGFKGANDTQSQQQSRQSSTRSFLGFDSEPDDDSSDEDGGNTKAAKEFLKKKQLKVDELLEGLPNWLERLFEGLIRKYSVSEWPPIR